ncbi:MAG: acetoacetate decarboxylase family protein [Ignavibacteriales bacterium]|nr:acetoacetate decarboxylase family protein [Ignavibacteriales bacterium]
MKKRTPEHAWSMPWDAPLVPEFPFTFRNVEVLTLSYRTTPEAIKAVLPPPLKPSVDCVLIHIYNMRDVEWLGSYGECNVMVGAELPKKASGGYSPYLFLDSDVGLAHGREVHGQPKKFAEARVETRKDLLVGTVTRNGIDIVTGTMGYKQQKGTLEEFKKETFDFGINLNYKVIPHIDGKPAIRQITSRKLTDVQVHECWAGPCTVELRPNIQAPVFKLPVVEMGPGLYWRADFTLVQGSIIHDYLK